MAAAACPCTEECGINCARALLAWSRELDRRPVTFAAFVAAQSREDNDSKEDRDVPR